MDDKREEYLNDVKGGGPSSCCGAGTYGDYMICEACLDHCGIMTEREQAEAGGINTEHELKGGLTDPSY